MENSNRNHRVLPAKSAEIRVDIPEISMEKDSIIQNHQATELSLEQSFEFITRDSTYHPED